MTASRGSRAGHDIGEHLRISHDGPVAVVTLNRPEKLNALARTAWADLVKAFGWLTEDGSIRAVVLTGAGDRAFCAGGDIASFQELETLEERRAYQSEAMHAFLTVERCALPVIAAVNGVALGGGCELAMACDIVLASERAEFALPEAGLGLVPGYGILRAPQVVGRQMAKLMIMTCDRLSAEEALAAGLVQRIHAHDGLMEAAVKLGRGIAAKSALAIEVGKRFIDRETGMSGFDFSVEALTMLHASVDAQEGARAFLEKRSPDFSPRFRNTG